MPISLAGVEVGVSFLHVSTAIWQAMPAVPVFRL
jgi:hypothetical protein